jgi:hypothetical protein
VGSALDLLICHNCGLVLRSKAKFCTGCGILATIHSPTMLAAVSSGSQPLSVTLRPDPLILERAVLNNQLKEMVNGNGNGHVSEEELESEKQELDFAPEQNTQSGQNGGSRLSSALGSNSAAPGKDSLLSMLEPPELSTPEPIEIPEPEPAPQEEQPSNNQAAEPVTQQTVPVEPVHEPTPSPIAAHQMPIEPAVTNPPPSAQAPAMEAPVASGQSPPLANPPANTTASHQPSVPWEQSRQPISPLLRSGLLDSVSDQSEASSPTAIPDPPVEPAKSLESPTPPQAANSIAPDTFNEAPIAPAIAPTTAPAPPTTPPDSFFNTPDTSAVEPVSAAPESIAEPAKAPEPPKADPLPELLETPVAAKPAPQNNSANDFFSATAQNSVSEPTASSISSTPQAEKVKESSSGSDDFYSNSSNQSSLFDFNAPGSLGNPSTKDSGAFEQSFMESFPPDPKADSFSTAPSKAGTETSSRDSTRSSREDDQGDEEADRPSRRRKTTTSRKTTTGTRSRAAKDDDEDDLDLPSKKSLSDRRKGKHDEDDEKPPLQALFSNLDDDMEILGQTMPKKNVLLAGIALVVVGFMCIGPIFGALGGLFTSVISQQNVSNVPNLTGEWQYSFAYQKQTYTGKMWLLQKGPEITGEGADTGPFQISGNYNPPKIHLVKQYMANGRPTEDKPVQLEGDVGYFQDGRSHIRGIYTLQKVVGVFTKRKVLQIQNQWEAYMLRLLDPSKLPQPTLGAPRTTGTGIGIGIGPPSTSVSGPETVKKTNQFFLMLAGVVVLIGVFLAFFSLKLFGPSGVLNILAKKEYIPSQFKSQHFKMVKELGKPAKAGSLILGERIDWNFMQFDKPKNINLPPAIRDTNPHVLVVGSGDKGKTRLLANMICHDIKSGDRAVVVIDSDGGLTDLIVNWIAANPKGADLAERVIIVDPTNKDGCSAYNPLEVLDNGDLQSAASAVVYGFKAIYTEPPGSQSQWNQQTANILRNAALLLMANGKTLTDLPTLLNENDFRDILLEKIERQKGSRAEFITLLETWGQYKRLARTDQWITWVEPILNRVSPMLSDPRIRPILTKPHGDLNLTKIIEESRVLLVKIPQGQLDQNGNLLGSLIVTGLKQAAMNLSPSKKRHPTALYLDEFDNFIEKETLDAITSETKKFQIGLVGCVKTLQHLPEDFRNTIIGVVGTMCVFAVAKKDGDMLGPQMFRVDGRKIKHRTMQNIFNQVNTSPQFELISDEEKLNIDRVVGQEDRTFFCYRVGTVAGVFHLRSPQFADVPDKNIEWSLIDEMYNNSQAEEEEEIRN